MCKIFSILCDTRLVYGVPMSQIAIACLLQKGTEKRWLWVLLKFPILNKQ